MDKRIGRSQGPVDQMAKNTNWALWINELPGRCTLTFTTCVDYSDALIQCILLTITILPFSFTIHVHCFHSLHCFSICKLHSLLAFTTHIQCLYSPLAFTACVFPNLIYRTYHWHVSYACTAQSACAAFIHQSNLPLAFTAHIYCLHTRLIFSACTRHSHLLYVYSPLSFTALTTGL